MLGLKGRPTVGSSEERAALKARQTQRLLFALVLLLVGIAVVVVTDRQFWFGSNQLILDGDESQPAATAPVVTPAPGTTAQPSQPAVAKKHVPATTSAAQKSTAPVVVTNRTVLPPLDVEIVAGSAHRATANAPKIQVTQPASNAAPVTDAAGRERISAEAPQASYPLLAQHMNVQGSVVLKAVIGVDGIIQDLRILSGPAILAAAAQQAVREWHFKPVVQNGQPVETMAKIVVNFTIKVADSSEKTTLAESRADGLLIFTR
jgi:protein TonB